MRRHTGGRQSKPTAVKQLLGNPGKRALNKREPKPLTGLPPCPEYLVEAGGADIWERMGSRLVRLGLMTESDGEALADVVECELVNADITRKMYGTEPVETNKNGELKKNPLYTLKLELLRERRAQHEKFGMTPASRSRLTVNESKPTDPLEAAMSASCSMTITSPPPPMHDEDEWSAQH